ncbi:MAG: glycosyl transferase family 1 [Phenylobacterium zucineum]|nr:MAG: glycosyl transferase family 1 [Phenylobacterium zucineum]
MSADAESPRGRLAILHPAGRMELNRNPFGKDVANLQLWQALARYGGYQRMDVLSLVAAEASDVAGDLFGERPRTTEIAAGLLSISNAPVEAGVLLRGQPDLYDLAWGRRRRTGDRSYSLVGLIHTLAPPAMRQTIANTQVAPMHPWDALICTSPSVRENLEAMFDGWGAHLAERTGGRPPPRPALPVIPLGVNAANFAALADRSDARARIRARYGLGERDVLVLWVGRLSYYEKAFPQAMMTAVREAQAAAGVRVAFAMAGWFPDAGDRKLYEAVVQAHAQGVDVRFEDGNDPELVGDLWAGSDIFLSLVDNIQETFGITPLEAMAAGLPVVASDWDGYRFTIRHGQEGFLIPTLLGPAGGGLGATMVERHVLGAVSYQGYVGGVAQHTAVNVGRAAAAIAELARNPDLRRRMGRAGRARVAEAFDWPVVARQIHDLTDELGRVRAAAADPAPGRPADPVKSDPFQAFAGFPTQRLTLDTRLTVPAGVTASQVLAVAAVPLDTAFPSLRATPELCARALEVLVAAGGGTVRDVLVAFPAPQRRPVELGLAWMAKMGFVDWQT